MTILLFMHLQIGYMTCDNASNNDTMMEWFAKYIEKKMGVLFDYEECRIW